MLYQFNADGTVSLSAHLERLRADKGIHTRIENRTDHAEMDAWIAQDFWRMRNKKI